MKTLERTETADEYLRGSRTGFDIPLLMVGTDLQKAVWNALLEVPYGKTASYLDLEQGCLKLFDDPS
jgi:methylated-DNA-[protein]-cysteine S-methyltransferase